VTNASAPPGKATKYARPELERRFLVATMPPGAIAKTTRLVDRYLEGTRLRLRAATEGDRTIYKLTQKIPGAPGLITTIYLDEAEHARLATLPALVLEKTRHAMPPFTIDVFARPRAGLFLAEAELADAEQLARLTPPPWAIAEVTHDARFTGGRLAATTEPELAALLASFGL
jgi:CYTH domain-containing protein